MNARKAWERVQNRNRVRRRSSLTLAAGISKEHERRRSTREYRVLECSDVRRVDRIVIAGDHGRRHGLRVRQAGRVDCDGKPGGVRGSRERRDQTPHVRSATDGRRAIVGEDQGPARTPPIARRIAPAELLHAVVA